MITWYGSQPLADIHAFDAGDDFAQEALADLFKFFRRSLTKNRLRTGRLAALPDSALGALVPTARAVSSAEWIRRISGPGDTRQEIFKSG